MQDEVLISIIIPMRNEREYVRDCLDSVLAQVAGRSDVEILCADGASTDGTREIVQEYAAAHECILLVDNPERIVPTAMNRAIKASRGRVIMRLDGHARYDPDYVANCLEVLERTGADNVGGYMKTLPAETTRVGNAIAAATSSPFGVGNSAFRVGGEEQDADTVPFGCFRRSVFDRVGFYDERLVRNQDIELNSRIRATGGRIVVSPKIRLTYYNRATYAGLRQQAYHNGLWNAYTLYLVGGGLRLRHLVPLFFVASIVLLAVGGLFWWPVWLALAFELASYLSITGAVSYRASGGEGRTWPLVMLAIVQLHVVYGLATLFGLLTAPLRFGLRKDKKPGKALADRRA